MTSLTIFVVVVLLIIGVVYPAVWSRRPERRCAAATVLRLLVRGIVFFRQAQASAQEL
jgi:hypothetical protein